MVGCRRDDHENGIPLLILYAVKNDTFTALILTSKCVICGRVEFFLLAGINEMFSMPIGASQRLNCERVKFLW